MAQFCTKCGFARIEGTQFCTGCGAPLGEAATPAAPAPAVPSPALRAPPAALAQPTAISPPRPAPASPVATNYASPAAAPVTSSGHPILKIALVVLGILFLLFVACVGAGVYFYYYHVKPKVAQIENTVRNLPIPTGLPQAPSQPAGPGGGAPGSGGPGAGPGATPSNPAAPVDISKALDQLGIKLGPNNPLANLAASMKQKPDPHFPALSPGDPSLYSGPLVLQPGMTIAESVSQPLVGDYDVLISITSVTGEGVGSNFSAQTPGNLLGASSPAGAAVAKSHMAHIDAHQDLMHATNILPIFSDRLPRLIPGVTMFLYSQDAFRAMKSGTGVDITSAVSPTPATLRGPGPNGIWSTFQTYTCHEVRSEAADAAFPILLNGRRVTLPAIHMACTAHGNSVTEYVLDDDVMPLTLATNNGQLTQINYLQFNWGKAAGSGAASAGGGGDGVGAGAGGGGGGGGTGGSGLGGAGSGGGGGQSIEQALKKEGHVDVYGIYFDFASDKLRPESAPVLAEIASALKNNPTWKLHVNGHTDNIGGDAYNLDLSNRRAAAVKQALVAQYHIDLARLDPSGFGATQPKESNDTPAGRARNRRVELIRE